MRFYVLSKKIHERFLLVYELQGCQKGVDFLTKHYGVKKMRIILNGRKVGNGDVAAYFQNRAYFTKKGLKKRTLLHEFYHHILSSKGYELRERIEEMKANAYANRFLKV